MKGNKELHDSILNEFGYDPLKALIAGDNQVIPDDCRIFEDALKVLGIHGIDLLRPLLKSENENTAINALHIFSELGIEGKMLIEDVIPYLNSKDESARWYVLEGVLSHIDGLPMLYVSMGLEAANDESIRLRKKAIDFISAVSTDEIQRALNNIQDNADQHRKGLSLLLNNTKGDGLLDTYTEEESVYSCYLFAKIIKLAKSGTFTEISEDKIEGSIPLYVKQKLALLKKRKISS